MTAPSRETLTRRITESTSVQELAAIVCTALQRDGIEAVLTGGAVVSIYTRNAYHSYDLHFVVRGLAKDVRSAMASIGFRKRAGRHFEHPHTRYVVEFPSGPLAIGNSPVTATALRLLTPTDCVMDRLAAFYHSNDAQGLDQAVAVGRRHRIDHERIGAGLGTKGWRRSLRSSRSS